jgi:hypothetical protein
MKGLIAGLALVIFIFAGSPGESADLKGILDSATKAAGNSSGGLGNDDVVNGLKEALQVGTGNAVTTVSKPDGYYKNPAIKIPLPGELQKAETLLKAAGYGPQVEQFELSMNRAAEKAAPEAKSIFLDAVKQMQFDDAKKILNGPDDAATKYFEGKTSGRLTEVFKPIVKDSMSQVGVTHQYQDLNAKLATIPMGGKLGFDLDQYVTDKSLKGLFTMLAEEEQKIRQNPAARTTDLLKKVFGSR